MNNYYNENPEKKQLYRCHLQSITITIGLDLYQVQVSDKLMYRSIIWYLKNK
jgi:hypothetical protein